MAAGDRPTDTPPAFFSPADALFMLSIALLVAGLLAFVHSAEPGRGAAIETALLTQHARTRLVGRAARTAFERGALEGAAGTTQAIFALLDVAVVAAIGWTPLGGGRSPAQILLLFGAGALVFGDTLWNWSTLAGTCAEEATQT